MCIYIYVYFITAHSLHKSTYIIACLKQGYFRIASVTKRETPFVYTVNLNLGEFGANFQSR